MEQRDKNEQAAGRVPETNPSKAMDSKRDVEKSNDQKIGQDFPGYPHYPAKEDIMDQRTDSHRVDMNVENLPNSKNVSGMSQRYGSNEPGERATAGASPRSGTDNDTLDIRSGTDADVTDDDLAVLNSSNDEIGTPQNFSNEDLNTDLDVPGAELDDSNEEVGEEDEENNYYSLGGENHENLEEDRSSVSGREA